MDFNNLATLTASQQAMVNWQQDLSANLDWRLGKHPQRVNDATVGIVFDRHNGKGSLLALHLFERCADGVYRHKIGPKPEILSGRQITEAVDRSEIDDRYARKG